MRASWRMFGFDGITGLDGTASHPSIGQVWARGQGVALRADASHVIVEAQSTPPCRGFVPRCWTAAGGGSMRSLGKARERPWSLQGNGLDVISQRINHPKLLSSRH